MFALACVAEGSVEHAVRAFGRVCEDSSDDLLRPRSTSDAAITRALGAAASIAAQNQVAGTPLELNQENDEAQDRRAQLRTPSELASHDDLLKKAEADIARVAQLATASNCHLKR